MPSPGQVNALTAIPKLVIDTTIGVVTAITAFFLTESSKKSEPIASTISAGTDAIVETVFSDNPVSTAYSWLKYIFLKIPEIVLLHFDNLANFFYIFCALTVLGQFDFLLDSIYTVTIVSVIVVYLVKARS